MLHRFLLIVFLGFPFIALRAQSTPDDLAMRAFAREYMAAYNRQDIPALRAMYTTHNVADSINGIYGNYIAQSFEDVFTRRDVTLLVRQISVTWSDAEYALIATGTYESYGATIVYDIPFRHKTAYRNTMVQENGRWKIARSVVTEIVKTLVYQKTDDLAAWKSALTGALHGSKVLGMEFGTPAGEPGTGYALLEWPSAEAARAFFENPEWQQPLQQTGRNEKAEVVFLAGK